MVELGLAKDLIDEVMTIAGSVKDDVLNRDIAEVQKESLFSRIGGEGAVDAAVDLFYNKVLADDRINSYFTKTDMTK